MALLDSDLADAAADAAAAAGWDEDWAVKAAERLRASEVACEATLRDAELLEQVHPVVTSFLSTALLPPHSYPLSLLLHLNHPTTLHRIPYLFILPFSKSPFYPPFSTPTPHSLPF